jgi:gluconolactonase
MALCAGAGLGTLLPHVASFAARMPAVRIVATGLQAPESPKPQADGSIMLVEMARGTLSRVKPGGAVSVIADLGGSPNGVAIGPDGAAYVCNSGGLIFNPKGDLMIPAGSRPDAVGRIQRVDLATGSHSTLYDSIDGLPLQGPNDLVFDRHGGFWFTAPRDPWPRSEQRGSVIWATTDGGTIRRAILLSSTNGIAISPDGATLFVVQSRPGRLMTYRITGPGTLATGQDGTPAGRLLWDSGGEYGFDSMAVDSAGNAVVGTLQHGDIESSDRTGVLSVIPPDGKHFKTVPLPDRYVTSVGFGGPGRRTAFATLTTTGRLAAIDWPRAGVRLTNT